MQLALSATKKSATFIIRQICVRCNKSLVLTNHTKHKKILLPQTTLKKPNIGTEMNPAPHIYHIWACAARSFLPTSQLRAHLLAN